MVKGQIQTAALSAATYPPLQKSQGRGTLFVVSVSESKTLGHPPGEDEHGIHHRIDSGRGRGPFRNSGWTGARALLLCNRADRRRALLCVVCRDGRFVTHAGDG